MDELKRILGPAGVKHVGDLIVERNKLLEQRDQLTRDLGICKQEQAQSDALVKITLRKILMDETLHDTLKLQRIKEWFGV